MLYIKLIHYIYSEVCVIIHLKLKLTDREVASNGKFIT